MGGGGGKGLKMPGTGMRKETTDEECLMKKKTRGSRAVARAAGRWERLEETKLEDCRSVGSAGRVSGAVVVQHHTCPGERKVTWC